MGKLYAKGNVLDLERTLDKKIRDQVSDMEFDAESVEDVITKVKDDHTFEPPKLVIPETLKPAKQVERTVEDDGRYSAPFSRRYKILDVTYAIEVAGTAELLDFSPQSLVFDYSSKTLEREGNKVLLKYEVPIDGGQQITPQVISNLKMLDKNIESLADWAIRWNDSLEGRVRSAVISRNAELAKRRSVSQQLAIKLK